MQQRLNKRIHTGANNRWLSDELIEAVRLSSHESPAPVSVTIDRNFGTRSQLHSTKQGHRRMWQHLATALLLMGSAAFSYLAWSQAELSPNLPDFPRRIASPDSLAVERTNVHALRVANRDLQLRIAELQEAIAKTVP